MPPIFKTDMKTIIIDTSAKRSYYPPEVSECCSLELQLMLAESDNNIDPGTDDPWGDF